MKITIDTTFKTIVILEPITIDELVAELGKIIPNFKEYKIIKEQYYTNYPYNNWNTDGINTSPHYSF